jgi:hypothetical protein
VWVWKQVAGILGEHTGAAGSPGAVGVEALVHHVSIGGLIDEIVLVARRVSAVPAK